MKRLTLPILLALFIFPTLAFARFSIPSDILYPKRFDPTRYTKKGMSRNECDKGLRKNISCSVAEFCKGRGVAMLKYFMKDRNRMMNLVQATANGDFLFVWLKPDKLESPEKTVFDFRRKQLDMQYKNRGIDIYNGASGALRMYAYFVDSGKGTGYALMKKGDYSAERRQRNSQTARKFVQQAERYTRDLVSRFWFPKIRRWDKRIEYLQAMLFLCCGHNVYSHGGLPKMQNYQANLDWTQQERMKMESGTRKVRNKVISENKMLWAKSTGKDSSGSTDKDKTDKVKTDTSKAQPPTDTSITDSSSAGSGQSDGSGGKDLGGGAATMFGKEMTERIEKSKPKKPKKRNK